MFLIVGADQFQAVIVERSKFISKYTDHELEKIRIEATVEGKEINERVTDYIDSSTKEITSQEGPITKKWKLTNRSYSYVGNMESVTYSWELEEIEETKLDKLVLDGLELIPSQYEEHFGLNDDLWAEVRVLLSDIEFKKFKELMGKDPIIVIRRGINEKPRPMDLALTGWSKDENCIKCQFSLFDYTEMIEISPMRPLWSLVRLVIKQNQIIDNLSNLLIQRGALKKEEYDRLKDEIPDRNLDIELELYRVDDLDEWKF